MGKKEVHWSARDPPPTNRHFGFGPIRIHFKLKYFKPTFQERINWFGNNDSEWKNTKNH